MLALDQSRLCGWAHCEPGGEPQWGRKQIGREGAISGEIGEAFEIFLEARIDLFRPAWIVYEQPFLSPNFQTCLCLLGMAWQIDLAARKHGIGCRSVVTGAATKFITGRGRFPGKSAQARRKAKKAAVLDACWAQGWRCETDDEADAIAILMYAESILYPPEAARRPPGPLFVGHAA